MRSTAIVVGLIGILVSIALIVFVVIKTKKVKDKAKTIQNVSVTQGMLIKDLLNTLGEPNSIGNDIEGRKIYIWSMDIKHYASIFATKTYYRLRVTVKDDKVIGYERE